MTNEELQKLKKKLADTREARAKWVEGMGDAANALPSETPLATGPVNQKQLQAMLRELEESEKKTKRKK